MPRLTPVPNTPLRDDPNQDSIWKRWLSQLRGNITPLSGTQSANFVLAGPTTGAAATPAFRALVTADLPAGTGTVTSVAQSFTGGLISVAGSPITTSGTLALTVAGTSGGIPYFSGATTWASSGALASQAIILGGGAGSAPTALALGSAHQVPEVNSGATALQYTSWPTMRRTIAAGQTLTVDADYSAVFVGYMVNNGTVTNNGAIAVI